MSDRIPFVNQLNNRFSNDCAWACMAMYVRAYTKRTPTIEQLAARHGVPNQFTTVAQLVSGLNAEGVPARWAANATWSWYRQMWVQEIYPTALLAMHVVNDNDGYDWAHFAITAGRAPGGMVKLLNPLRRTAPHLIPEAEFKLAITKRSRYVGGTNNPLIAIYPLMPLPPSALYSDRVQAVASSIRLAVG
jgi:ABC-type bacteriocin/lantibiotic exporter with double-glycine peptidase domain